MAGDSATSYEVRDAGDVLRKVLGVNLLSIGAMRTDQRTETTRIILSLADFFSTSLDVVLTIGRSDGTELQTDGLHAEKIICEICLFFHVAHAQIARSPSIRAQVEAFIEDSARYVFTKSTLLYIERYPSSVHLFALLLLCAQTYSVELEWSARLNRALRSPAYLSVERTPFRFQESVWLYEQITGDHLPWMHGCVSSLLSRVSHPCVLTREHLYAKTHAAMYETNFGKGNIPASYSGEGILWGLRHDLNSCFSNADWDLVGELCMACHFLGMQDSTRPFRNALDEVFKKFGVIPSITFQAECAAKLPEGKLSLYEFAHSYHSTLVYCLLKASVGDDDRQTPFPEEGIRGEDVLTAIATFFGPEEFEVGPLSKDWYAGDVALQLASLVDGYATRCYKSLGRKRAVQFIDSIPNARENVVIEHTRQYFCSI